MVNIDDNKIVYDRLKRKTVQGIKDTKITSDIKFYAFAATSTNKLQQEVAQAGYMIYNKPSSSEALDMLRHMVPADEYLVKVDDAKIKRAKAKANMKVK